MFTFKVEDGTGYSDSTSYSTVEYADEYVSFYLSDNPWDTLSTEDKEKALMRGTRFLDTMVKWSSDIKENDQALAWPRLPFVDAAGREVKSDIVPQAIIDASVELAVSSLSDSLTTERVSIAEEQFGSSRDRYASPVTIYGNSVVADLIKSLSYLGYGRNRSSVAIIYRA